MTDDIDKQGYRANVGIILANDDGQLFWAGRAGRRGWQFPQGGIHPRESVEEAMYRELMEEVGLESGDVEIIASTDSWLRYTLPHRYRRESLPICIGQKQRWFLLRLVSGEHAVRLDRTDVPEFDRWRWVDFWYPVGEVIYFKRRVYACALEEFGPHLFPEGPPPRPKWWRERRSRYPARSGRSTRPGRNGQT